MLRAAISERSPYTGGMFRAGAMLIVAFTLAACGMKGDLYLPPEAPAESVTAPVPAEADQAEADRASARRSRPRPIPHCRAERVAPRMPAPRRLVLIDGNSYLYRAFHALPPLTTSKGQPTGAIFGFLNMLRQIQRTRSPDLIAVVMDAPGPTFRDELYAHYKANREAMPDDLQAQIPPLMEMVRALGITLLRESGVEADDVIGTLARRAYAAGLDTLIATSDKDMSQLVNDRIRLFDGISGRMLDAAGVLEKFGVPPERIIDWLTLVGDTSDNIPGVPSVGPKTAAKWLSRVRQPRCHRRACRRDQGQGRRKASRAPGAAAPVTPARHDSLRCAAG